MGDAKLHKIDFTSLGPEILTKLGEDFVRALSVPNPMLHWALGEKDYADRISEVVSRASRSPTGLSSRDATELAETFRKAMSMHFTGSPEWCPWFRLYAHALLRGPYLSSCVELCDKSLDYEPLGFVDIWKGNCRERQVYIKAIRIRDMATLAKIKMAYCQIRRLPHPNVLPITFSTAAFPFFIMSPRMPDGNIMQYIQKEQNANRLKLLAGVCAGLSHLHGLDVLHGCITPGDIMIARNGNACLGDFGIITAERLLPTFKLETIRYMAPERFGSGNRTNLASRESDVYSIAMTSFTVLTGVLPYDGIDDRGIITSYIKSGKRPPRPRDQDASRWLQHGIWDMIAFGWSEDPKERWEIPTVRKLFLALGHQEAQDANSGSEIGQQQRDPESEIEGLVDEMDRLLENRTLSGQERLKLLNEFCKTCSRYRVIPKSMYIPDCSQGSVEVAKGGFANVSRGTYKGHQVAIKVVRVYTTSDLDAIFSRFCREGVVWKHLRHTNILPLIGVTVSNRRFAMISAWMENGNISEFVKKDKHVNRAELLVDVANGLKYMHGLSIVHGDLKGPNILINKNRRACLADFGLTTVTSVATRATRATVEGEVVLSGTLMSFTSGGTYRWMSPELLDPERFGMPKSEGNRPTRQSDCYALGMVIYEVLCGHYPYSEIRPEVLVINTITEGGRPKKPEGEARLRFSDELWRTIELCWSEDRNARPDVEGILSCLNVETVVWYMREF